MTLCVWDNVDMLIAYIWDIVGYNGDIKPYSHITMDGDGDGGCFLE